MKVVCAESGAIPGKSFPECPPVPKLRIVSPTTYIVPALFTARPRTKSSPLPPRKVAPITFVRPGLSLATKPSTPALIRSGDPPESPGKSHDPVEPATYTFPVPSSLRATMTSKSLPPRNVAAWIVPRLASSRATKPSSKSVNVPAWVESAEPAPTPGKSAESVVPAT
ncbi:MAG: hypothetical protein FJZ38_10575 [Candidatus Rokubacteria bacterium]|nr:hypothetical protein [Candidatus Rokubacteria bacterium]